MGWINRFLDQCYVRGLAWHTLRGYAFDLTHFIRWWADRHATDDVTEQALTTSSLLDYMRYQIEQQPRPAANTNQQARVGDRVRLALRHGERSDQVCHSTARDSPTRPYCVTRGRLALGLGAIGMLRIIEA